MHSTSSPRRAWKQAIVLGIALCGASSCRAGNFGIGDSTLPIGESNYQPRNFAVLSSLEQDDFARALREVNKADHIAVFFASESTRTTTIDFFTSITGSRIVALAILENAARNEVPHALAFALAYEESRYKTAAVGHNADSIDRGLFQLNNKSFPKLNVEEFFDPQTNARHGMAHLSFCLEAGGNEVAALAMYNAGQTKVLKGGTPRKTLDYIYRIMNYKLNLEALFEAQVVAKTLPETSQQLLVALNGGIRTSGSN